MGVLPQGRAGETDEAAEAGTVTAKVALHNKTQELTAHRNKSQFLEDIQSIFSHLSYVLDSPSKTFDVCVFPALH